MRYINGGRLVGNRRLRSLEPMVGNLDALLSATIEDDDELGRVKEDDGGGRCAFFDLHNK